jgi:hypothetical protein
MISINTGINDTNGPPVTVDGGAIQSETGKTNSFTMGSVSGLTNRGTDGGGNGPYTFTATLFAPTNSADGFIYVGNSLVYTVWTLLTPGFGVIPMTMTAWNSGTDEATFQLYEPWVYGEFGGTDLTTAGPTNLSNEIAAVTTVYVAEQVVTARGRGIVLNGVTTENENVCAMIMDVTGGSTTEMTSEVHNILALSSYYFFTGDYLPEKYCGRTMPTIRKATPGELILDGGDWNPPIGTSPISQRQMIETTVQPSNIVGRNLTNLSAIYRHGNNQAFWAQVDPIYHFWETEARGIGTWDRSYTLPSLQYGRASSQINNGDQAAPFCGVEPCPSAVPNLPASLLATVCPGGNIASCGSLGTFNTYSPVACRTVFKSVDWNTGAVTPPSTVGGGIFLRSNSCPGYSWGQAINDTSLQAFEASTGQSFTSVTWTHIGQSPVLYLDAITLTLMFPGLGFGLDSGDGSGIKHFVVTGVYEDLGYATVMGTDTSGNLLPGTKTSVYTCSSGCTIGQAPFSWSAY